MSSNVVAIKAAFGIIRCIAWQPVHTFFDMWTWCDRSRVEGGLYRTKQGGLDYSHDFFGKAAFLTVSGQLQAEYFATALSNVYTFAPTFRAEGQPSL